MSDADYWREKYAEEKRARNEAITGNIQKMKKLEAVRKQLVEFPCINIQDYQRMIRKIKKILEIEG